MGCRVKHDPSRPCPGTLSGGSRAHVIPRRYGQPPRFGATSSEASVGTRLLVSSARTVGNLSDHDHGGRASASSSPVVRSTHMSDTFDRSQLDGKDREQLSEIASALGVKSISRMRKADLVDAIVDATGRQRRDGSRTGPRRPSGLGRSGPRRRRRRPRVARRRRERARAPTRRRADDMALIRPRRRATAGTNGATDGTDRAPTRHDARRRRPVMPASRPTDRRRRHGTAADSDAESPTQATAASREPAAQWRDDDDGHGNRRRRRRRGRDRERGPRSAEGGPSGRTGAGRAGERAEPPRGVHRRADRRRRSARPARRGLRLPAHVGLPRRSQRRVRLRVAGAPLRTAQGRLREGRDPPAGEQREVSRRSCASTSINGMTPDEARSRVRFEDLTPLFPDSRLRLELDDDPGEITGRIIDLISPIGKGQRGMIVSPPKAGKTTIIKQIVYSIERNNPECTSSCCSSTSVPKRSPTCAGTCCAPMWSRRRFDRPSDEHCHVAELTIERAKRLVEMRQGRRDHPRRHHPARPGVQPRGAGIGPDHVGWYRRRRAVPAEEVLRCGPQRRRGRLAHDPRHRARRDELEDGRAHLRGVQGHREHGAAARPAHRRPPDLPGHRRRAVEHPARGAALRPQRPPAGLEAAAGAQRARRRRPGWSC